MRLIRRREPDSRPPPGELADTGHEGSQNQVDDIIICRDVHKWFGQFHALRGITTTVRRSEVVDRKSVV